MSIITIGLSVIQVLRFIAAIFTNYQYEIEFNDDNPTWSLVLLYLIFAASVILGKVNFLCAWADDWYDSYAYSRSVFLSVAIQEETQSDFSERNSLFNRRI